MFSECGFIETVADMDNVVTKPNNSMDEASGRFILKLLAEQKLNQVNIQCIMNETTSIIKTAVKRKLNDVSAFLASKNVRNGSCVLNQLEEVEDPFILLKNQRKQNQFFTKHFGIYIS